MRLLSRMLIPAILAMSALIGTAAGQSLAATPTPDQMQAAYDKVVTADDGMSVWDPLRNEKLFATGDATMVAGTDYSHSWGYPHMVWIAQTGPESFKPLRLYPVTQHYGWQPVPDSACPPGKVFWAGGLLYAPGARKVIDYGACVNPADGTGAVDYAAVFDAATLVFQGLRPLGAVESWSDAVAVNGGWWVLGSRSSPGTCWKGVADCFVGDSAFIPSGDWARPWDWQIVRGVIQAADDPGNVITPFLLSDGWHAITKKGDMYGSTVVIELRAARPNEAWALTGKSWPTTGSNTYSVVYQGGYFTYASAPPYQLNFERF